MRRYAARRREIYDTEDETNPLKIGHTKQTNIMKTSLRHLTASLAASAVLVAAPAAFAQVAVSQTTTTQSSGTISEMSPTTVVLKSESSAAPVTYSYSKTTTVTDENGNPVDMSIIKTGVPVQVIYAKDGDGMVAQKIIVHKTMATGGVVEKHESSTTTTTTH